MSRISKWKLEKTKVKVVFRLQFHATHIPQVGWDKPFISLIPVDTGKPTAKTTKANVRNGACKWGDPIYETTGLLQDVKTKQYDEKLYKLVVSMGSSRSSFLGEASVNLADYADALKPFDVALPLHGCDSGAILNVTVQLLTSKTGFREFEQQRELRERGFQTTTDQNNTDGLLRAKVLSSEDTPYNQINKINPRVRLKGRFKEKPSPKQDKGPNEEHGNLGLVYDVSSVTSKSSEKFDTSSMHEIDSLTSMSCGDLTVLSQSSQRETHDHPDHQLTARGTAGWVPGCGSDYSADNELANAYEENSRLSRCLEVAELSINELKLEVSSLRIQADQVGAEAQKLSQQLGDEISSGGQLEKEISVLKLECSKLQGDLQRVNSTKSRPSFTEIEANDKNQDPLIHDVQLKWVKGLLAMEDKIRDLKSKECFEFHERDYKSINSDLEDLLAVLTDAKQAAGMSISSLASLQPEIVDLEENMETSLHKSETFVSVTEFDTNLYQQPELGMIKALSRPQLLSHQYDSVDAASAMKSKINDLLRELSESRAERESLTKKMGQMEFYYEALVQELEENQRQMLGELQSLRNEHSTCHYTISSSKVEIETLQRDMDEKLFRYDEEKNDFCSVNRELEIRATTAEASLKRARLNYSVAVNRLQNDLELLSSQVFSMFESNESVIRQAFEAPPLPGFQIYPEVAQNITLDQAEFHAANLSQSQNEHIVARKHTLGGDMLLEDLKKALHLQGALYQKVEEEHSEMHFMNIFLDVYSKSLQETLTEASTNLRVMKDEADELRCQLELSIESKELLMQRLQAATVELYSLNEYKTTCVAKCNDMALQNQNLEESLRIITQENRILMDKIAEWECMTLEYKSYQSKYEACMAEKTVLEKEADELRCQQELSIESKELLMQRMQAAVDELSSLNDYKTTYVAKCNEMALQNQSLADSLEFVTCENKSLMDKVAEWECLTLEYKSYQSKYEACMAEKTVLEKEANELRCQQELSIESKELLMQKLQAATDELYSLNKCKTACVAKCNDMGLQNQNLADSLRLVTCENSTLMDKIAEWECLVLEYKSYQSKYEKCMTEKTVLENSLKKEALVNENLQSDIFSLQEELKAMRANENNLFYMVASNKKDLSALIFEDATVDHELESEGSTSVMMQLEELHRKSREKILRLLNDNDKLICERDMAQVSLSTSQSKFVVVKQKFEHDMQNMVDKLSISSALVQKLQLEIDSVSDRLEVSSEAEETFVQQQKELSSILDHLEVEVKQLISKNEDIGQEIVNVRSVADDLGKAQLILTEMTEEKQGLVETLEKSSEESSKMALQVVNLTERSQYLQDELDSERSLKDKLQSTVLELTSQLNDKHLHLVNFDKQNSELVQLKKLVSNLESEKSRCSDLLSHYEDRLRNAYGNSSSTAVMESQLLESYDFAIVADIIHVFTRNQYEDWIEELVQQVYSSNSCIQDLEKKLSDMATALNQCLDNEAVFMKENGRLVAKLSSLKSELDVSVSHNRVLCSTNNAITTQLEEYRTRANDMEASYVADSTRCAHEVEQLKKLLSSLSEEIDYLMVSREELEVRVIVLQEKFDEQAAQLMMSWEESNDELIVLRNNCRELNQKLSEQSLKTEEFKNLSTHLKDLKDKADSEKRESEIPLSAAQESLRIVFIKEQYETKLQEQKFQLSLSKKHSEEMLWKLQDAVDEIEKRKKSEASHLKKNEELGMKILDLESELQTVISEKREKVNVYDRMKAELECSLISLECCKEEKQKLEASLQECNEEKSKISVELNTMKESVESGRPDSTAVSYRDGREIVDMTLSNDKDGSTAAMTPQSDQDLHVSDAINGAASLIHINHERFLHNEKELQALTDDHLRAQSLKSSLDNLSNELERMKNENLLFSQDSHYSDPDFPGLDMELMQLRKVNEELGSMFPLFHEYSGSGNALERVLALEIELAEALRAKKKSNTLFQSSFLKQHSDEVAIYHSFRDINNLIKEMLEIKGRHTAVETELKDMHDRYSQLSLQFAEVEGERQKLMMTLKNVRALKKARVFNP